MKIEINNKKLTAILLITLSLTIGYITLDKTTTAIPAPSTSWVCEPGGCGSNPCTYMIYLSGSTIMAKNCATGGNDYSGTDIWTLLNTIDSGLTAGRIYHIYIRGGYYNGSSTFTPGADKGYYLSGDGAPSDMDFVGGLLGGGGTTLNYTGTTGSAIDTTNTWTGGPTFYKHLAQTIRFEGLTILAKATSSSVVKLTNLNSMMAYNLMILGNDKFLYNTLPIPGSIGLNLPSSANAGRSVIDSSTISGFSINILVNTDHLSITHSEIAECGNSCIKVQSGDEMDFSGLHFFADGGNGSAIAIDDRRTPTNGFVLTMTHIITEGMNGYANYNGGYYIQISSGGLNCCNGFLIDSNLGTGIHIVGGQTTLTGTTAGSIIWSMPFKGNNVFNQYDSYKKFIAYINGYQNSGGTPQTIAFPNNNAQGCIFGETWCHIPTFTKNDLTGTTVSTTTLTLPTAMGAPVTGWIILEGY